MIHFTTHPQFGDEPMTYISKFNNHREINNICILLLTCGDVKKCSSIVTTHRHLTFMTTQRYHLADTSQVPYEHLTITTLPRRYHTNQTNWLVITLAYTWVTPTTTKKRTTPGNNRPQKVVSSVLVLFKSSAKPLVRVGNTRNPPPVSTITIKSRHQLLLLLC